MTKQNSETKTTIHGPNGKGKTPPVDRQKVAADLEAERAQATRRPTAGTDDDDAKRAAIDKRTGPQPIAAPVAGAVLFDSEFTPERWIVGDLIPEGNLYMLVGRAKAGKSFLLLQLCKAIDTGAPFLGRKVNRVKVLYVALEDGKKRLRRRLHLTKWRPSNVDFFTEKTIPLANGGMEQIRAWSHQYGLIIIDTLSAAIRGSAEENDNTAIGPLIQELADITHAGACTILLSHHTRKGNGGNEDDFETIRGGSAIRAAYDHCLLLQRTRGEAEATLKLESRDLEAEDMTIRFEDNNEITHLGDGKRIEDMRAGRQVAVALREMGDEQTAEAIAERMGISRQGAQKQLDAAEREGMVKRRPDPNTKGKKPPFLWSLK